MTDPVNPDSLKTPYDHFSDLRQAYAEGFERAHVEADRLQAAVRDAPHDSFCLADLPSGNHVCICWKATLV